MARRMRNMFSHYFNFFIWTLRWTVWVNAAQVAAKRNFSRLIQLHRQKKHDRIVKESCSPGTSSTQARLEARWKNGKEREEEWKSHKINLLLKITRRFVSGTRFFEMAEPEGETKSLRVQALMPQWDEERKERNFFSLSQFILCFSFLLLHDVFDRDDDIKLSEWVRCVLLRLRQSSAEEKKSSKARASWLKDDGKFFIRI